MKSAIDTDDELICIEDLSQEILEVVYRNLDVQSLLHFRLTNK